jgi:predicted alpha/beta superfamily hydrolase
MLLQSIVESRVDVFPMLHTHHISSVALGLTRRVCVWLPPGVRASTRYFPALYLNDGQNLFDPARSFIGVTWGVRETVNRLVRRGLIPPLIVVGIDHGGQRRAREFLPVEDDRNRDSRHPLGRAYVEFVTRDVMPFVQRRYPVDRRASSNGIGGSSYGAVAALFAVLDRPGVFGRLLLESPSLYVGDAYLLRRARRAERWPGRVYLGVGTAETSRQDWNEETVEDVRKLDGILRRARLGPRRLMTKIEAGASHTEAAWAARLPEALTFLFG